MFHTGSLLLFTPFHFKDGATPKEKFFLVLKNDGENIILASLPTSVNKAPLLIDKTHGCVDHDDRRFNCYVYEPGKEICDTKFSFSKPTFIYPNNIEDYSIQDLSSRYRHEGKDFKIIGTLLAAELNNLIECIRTAGGGVKRRIKRMLLEG